MADQPSVILSGFADEAANQKTAEQQFSAFASLGLQYYTIRFIDAGGGVKNVMKLTKSEIAKIRHLDDECIAVEQDGVARDVRGRVRLVNEAERAELRPACEARAVSALEDDLERDAAGAFRELDDTDAEDELDLGDF